MPRPGKVKSDTPKIDRSKYKSQIEKGEYSYTGTPGAFGKDILAQNNHKIVGGSEDTGDLVTQSGDDYFLYSQQPGYVAGLVNIGKINPYATPVTAAPVQTQTMAPQQVAKPKPVIDPNRQSLNFNNPNYYTDPNSGKNYSYETNKEIPTMTNEYKYGGVTRKFAAGGSPYFNEQTGTYMTTPYQSTPTQQAAPGANMAGVVGPVAGISELGGQYLDATNEPTEEGFTNVKKATGAGALKGAGKGATTGAAIGSVIPGVGTVVGGAAGALIGAGVGAFTANKKAKNFNSDLQGDIDEANILKKQLGDERSLNTSVGNSFAERGFNDGGEIKGPGTAKSDSIKAKIRPGSFIVPAKNASVAKEIKQTVLGDDPNKKAVVKQAGGVPGLSVSNGEMLFTPEEVQELTAAGINLDALAPEAKQKLRDTHEFKCGGGVKMYAKGGPVEEERKKIAAQRKKELAMKAAAEAKAKKDRETGKQRADVYDALTEQNKASKKAAAELKKQEAELKALRNSYDSYSKESDFEVNRDPTSGETLVGSSSKPTTESVRQEKEKLLAMIEAKESEYNKAKQAVAFAKDEKNFVPGATKGLPRGDSEFAQNVREAAAKSQTVQKNIIDPRDVPSAAEVAAAKTSAAPVQAQRNGIAGPVIDAARLAPTPITEDDTAGMYPPAATQSTLTPASAPTMYTDIPKTEDLNTGANTRATGLLSQLNLDQIANYALPAMQAGLGTKMLREAGRRPVDDYDPDFLKSIDDARTAVKVASKNAQFGFSPEEKFAMQQDNQAMTNSQRFAARNASGGSAANAIVNDTAAINSSYGRGLASRIADNQLRLQKESLVDAKQQALDNKISEKAGVSRMLFGDTMGAWQQNQQAASQILGAGVSNAIGAQRLNSELNYRRQRDEKYNPQYTV